MSPREQQKQNKQKAKPHSLESVARRELGIELDKEHQGADWGGELSRGMLAYAAKDAQVLLPIAEIFESKIESTGLERISEIEHRALLAMVWMTNAGVPFDSDGWSEYLKGVKEEIGRLKEELDALAPERPGGGEWNWGSPKQVMEVLSLLGVNLPNTEKKTLGRCEHPLAKILLEHRKAAKMFSAFGPKLLSAVRSDERIYAPWRQIGTVTGRKSCSNPNLQQIPREALRGYVQAPEGRVLIASDYSQAEPRILAKVSGDPNLLGAFVAGEDPYKAAASGMFGVPEKEVTDEQRSTAKVITLSIFYGKTPKGLAEDLETSVREARGLMKRYFGAHPKVKAYLEETAKEALSTGTGRTLTGRIRRFGDRETLRGAKRKAAKRKAKNFPMQGTCADGLKLGMALLYERRHECPGAVPVLAVHDELVLECDEGDVKKVEDWLEKAMIEGMDRVVNGPEVGGPHVPIEVEIKSGRTWAG